MDGSRPSSTVIDLYPAVPFVFERSVNSYPKPDGIRPAAPAEGNTDTVGVSHR